jgi:hypothetical protein
MGLLSSARAAFRRLRIRSAYNRNLFSEARVMAMNEIGDPTNHAFACDLVIRSLYNDERWEELIAFTDTYSGMDSGNYKEKAKWKLSVILGIETRVPENNVEKEWNPKDLLANWYQEDHLLWLRYPSGWIYWEMPTEFQLHTTHPNLLALALNVVLRPLGIGIPDSISEHRPFGTCGALAYSGGFDSTAAAILLPDSTILSYHRRSFPSQLNHGLADRLFGVWKKRTSRTILQVPSNHELVRTNLGKPAGFSTDFASGVHLILLADTLNLGRIAYGTPIDNTWLKKGSQYRDFSKSDYWCRWKKRFAAAGLHLEFPINHISEAGALRICQNSGFMEYINSCLRGNGAEGCGKCWKCFNKNGPLGRPMDFNGAEIQTFLNRVPMPTAQHALWALKSQNLESRTPHLARNLEKSFEWWEGYYPPGIDLIGKHWRDAVETATKKYLQPMEFPFLLEEVNLYPNRD